MVALIAAGILAYVLQIRKYEALRNLDALRYELSSVQKELDRSQLGINGLVEENQRLKSEMAAWAQRYNGLYGGFERLYKDGLLEQWQTMIQNTTFRNRSELGAYLLFPMLWFLEYPESAFYLDRQVSIVGAVGAPQYVSCIVYGVNATGANVPLFLLETIAPGQSFTSSVVDEILLKAFSAQVIKFAMTNGEEFIFYNMLNRSKAGGRIRQFSLRNLKDNSGKIPAFTSAWKPLQIPMTGLPLATK